MFSKYLSDCLIIVNLYLIMNFLTFFTDKKKKQANSDNKKLISKKVYESRLNTEAAELKPGTINQILKTQSNQLYANCEQTNMGETKYKILKATIDRISSNVAASLQQQLKMLEMYEQDKKIQNQLQLQTVATHFYLLKSKFYRFQPVDHTQAMQNYRNLINSFKKINQKLSEKPNPIVEKGFIYVKNQDQFCQYFRYIFGKPAKQFNNKFVRKIFQQIWYFFYFQEAILSKIMNTFKMWIHGIMLPENPTRIQLHKAIFKNDDKFITKACQLKLNSPIYCHINQADALGITPLALAIYLKKFALLPNLYLEGADSQLVPICRFQNSQQVFEEIKQHLLKPTISNVFKQYFSERYAKNILEYSRDINDMKLVAHLITMEQTRESFDLLNKKYLSDQLEAMPDCSFQLSWKSQSIFPLSGALPCDVITIYKKRSWLRIDFNVLNVFSKDTLSKGKYSLIFKGKPETSFYFIDHKNKKIVSVIKQASISQIERLCESFIKQGNKANQTITECKLEQKIIKIPMSLLTKKINIELEYTYETVKKDYVFSEFKNILEYQKQFLNSELINYTLLGKSNLKYLIKEPINQQNKVKRKKYNSKVKFEIATMPHFELNLSNLHTILKVVKNYTPIFDRIQKFMNFQKNLNEIGKRNIYHEFPNSCKFQLSFGINLVLNFQNFTYLPPKNQIFELTHKLQEQQQFDKFQPEENFLRGRKQSIDESFSMSVTKFLRPGQALQEEEIQKASKQFEMLLAQTNNSDFIEVMSNFSSRRMSKCEPVEIEVKKQLNHSKYKPEQQQRGFYKKQNKKMQEPKHKFTEIKRKKKV